MKFFQANYKAHLIIFTTLLLVILISILSLTNGEYDITPSAAIGAVFGQGSPEDISIIQGVRLPRIVTGIMIGAALSLSGLFCTTALKNPLADSGILGIQSGATAAVLLVILVFPVFTFVLPLFALVGGLFAFALIIIVSYNGTIKPMRLVLSGVAINAFFSAIIGILTIFNPQKLQSALSWLNGSLVSVSAAEMHIILIYTVIAICGAFLFIPILKLLSLDDGMIVSLGKNPNFYRLITLIYSVILAVISVAYVGVISFVGIIVPKASKTLVGTNLTYVLIESILLGALLVISADFAQRILFAPMEVPVGIVIGLIGTPVFLFLLRGQND